MNNLLENKFKKKTKNRNSFNSIKTEMYFIETRNKTIAITHQIPSH